MNFIEELFSVSPDGGTGLKEGLLLTAILVVIAGAALSAIGALAQIRASRQ